MNGIERYFNPLKWFAALVLAAVVAGCGGDGGDGSGSGTVGVWLTDSPACGFDAVNVTVSRVRVHMSSRPLPKTTAAGPDITLSPPRKINLLDLTNGVADKSWPNSTARQDITRNCAWSW